MKLLDHLIRFSLQHRALVAGGAALLLVFGSVWIATLPVDIFPDLPIGRIVLLGRQELISGNVFCSLTVFLRKSGSSPGRNPTGRVEP